MIGLFKDKEGKRPYDFGKGKDLIEFTKVYRNGKLEKVEYSDVYLVAKGTYEDVKVRLENVKGKVQISLDNHKFYDEINLGKVSDKVYKIYFKIDSEDFDFNLCIEAIKNN